MVNRLLQTLWRANDAIVGPGPSEWDSGIYKSFKFSESKSLELRGRGEAVNNFNGNGSGTVSGISISDEQILGTTSDAAIFIWNHASGTFMNIRVSDIQIDGCGGGDGNGCVILDGAMTGIALNGIQVLDVPSGEYGLYETGSVGTVNMGSFASSGGAGVFSSTGNLLGNLIASGAPSGGCVTGAQYQNTSGSSGSTSYACVSSAWADVK